MALALTGGGWVIWALILSSIGGVAVAYDRWNLLKTLAHHLKQKVKDDGVRFLDLIEEHDAPGVCEHRPRLRRWSCSLDTGRGPFPSGALGSGSAAGLGRGD